MGREYYNAKGLVNPEDYPHLYDSEDVVYADGCCKCGDTVNDIEGQSNGWIVDGDHYCKPCAKRFISKPSLNIWQRIKLAIK